MRRTVIPLLPQGASTIAAGHFRGPWVAVPETPAGWRLVGGVHGGRGLGSASLRLQDADASELATDVAEEVPLQSPMQLTCVLPTRIGPRVRVTLDVGGGDPAARIAAYLETAST